MLGEEIYIYIMGAHNNVYLNCQLLISHNLVADGVKPEHASHTSDICHVVTACVMLFDYWTFHNQSSKLIGLPSGFD